MERKHAQHNKNKVHIVYFFKLVKHNLTSSWCVSIRIFNLTSQIDIEWCRLCCFMGYSEIASWCGFPPYWRPRGDFVDHRILEREFGIKYISSILWISEISSDMIGWCYRTFQSSFGLNKFILGLFRLRMRAPLPSRGSPTSDVWMDIPQGTWTVL